MIPDNNPLTMIRDLLGVDIEVRKYQQVRGKPVPQEIWIPATIVAEDKFGVDVVYQDGVKENLRKNENKFRRRTESSAP